MDSASIEARSGERMFRLLKIVAEHAAEGIVVVDATGIIRFVNPAAVRAHGYIWRADLLGRNLSMLYGQEQMADHVMPFIQDARRLGQFEGPLDHVRKDGAVFHTYTKMITVKDEMGDSEGLIIFHADALECEEEKSTSAASGEQLDKEPAGRGPLDARDLSQNHEAAAFRERLMRAMGNRHSGDDKQMPVVERVDLPRHLAAEHNNDRSHGDDPAQAGTEHDGNDPYLELRKASGGPLDTTKLADLAELLKRLS